MKNNKMKDIVDPYGRRINYLRLSITDRCNLRCIYCSQGRNFRFLPHKEILTYEELIRLIHIGMKLGVEKVRLTGGEPFVRKGFLSFLAEIMRLFPKIDLRITTNGTLLTKDVILQLKSIGIKVINVSLDTFNREKFRRITGMDLFANVVSAISELIKNNIKTKINVVALRSINHMEVREFVRFAFENPVDVRFIEFMDLSQGGKWQEQYFFSADEIFEIIAREFSLTRELGSKDTRGPARMYKILGGRGRIGIISPLSNHFCGSCNRFRITADGRLRTCLFSEKDYRLKPILRNDKFSQETLYKIMNGAAKKKPLGYEIISRFKGNGRGMYAIGG